MKRPNPLPPDQMTPPSAAPNCAACWRLGWCGCGSGTRRNHLQMLEKVAYTLRPTDAFMQLQLMTEATMTTHDPIPARLAALKTATTPALKAQWRELFDSEPPPFNRRYLESRLAYRIQELAYGGLKPETIRRLERLGEELDGGDRKKSVASAPT